MNWKKLPSLHSARWNSRSNFLSSGVLSFTAYPNQLDGVCDLWVSVWYSDQHFNQIVYDELLSAISVFGCQKALRSFTKHWIN